MPTIPPHQNILDHQDPGGRVLLMFLEESMAKRCRSAAAAASFDSFYVKSVEEASQLFDGPVPTCLIAMEGTDCLRIFQNSFDQFFCRTATVFINAEEAMVERRRSVGQFAFSLSATQESIQAEITSAIRQATERQWKWSMIEDFQRRLEKLTPEEFVVLDAVCLGNLNKQIAKKIGVSVRTIEQRRQRVFQKMEVGSAIPLAAQLATVKALVFPLHRRDSTHREVPAPSSPVVNLTSALSNPAHTSGFRGRF